MKLTLQYIIGILILGAFCCLFFYGLGHRDGMQETSLKVEQAINQALQKRVGINEAINSMDSFSLCIELGGVPEQCQQLRGLAED
ncbi:hypothetical protein ACLBWZ_14750 [Brucellaceae bacterium C25G]